MLHYYVALADLSEVPIVDKLVKDFFYAPKAADPDFEPQLLSFRTPEERAASIAKLKEQCNE
jgi:hypothetical protein